MRYTIVHPHTRDHATAETLAGAKAAGRTLRSDALDAGTCTSPRIRCLVVDHDGGRICERGGTGLR